MNKLFRIRISSWNAQGGFRKKSQLLDFLLSSTEPNILLIQEQGTIGGTGYQIDENFCIGDTAYTCKLLCADPFAKVHRCTTAIMVEDKLLPHIKDIGYKENSTGRPMCYVKLASGVMIATIHATANSEISIGEVKEMISELDQDDSDWIFMGDFNSRPFDYDVGDRVLTANIEQCIQYEGTSRNSKYCNIIYDSQPTQGSEGKRYNYLDFAFTNENHSFRVYRITNQMVYHENGTNCSDHNLIQLSVGV